MQEKLDQIINAYQSGKLKTNDFRSQVAMFINEYSNAVVHQTVATRKNDFIEDAYKKICLNQIDPDYRAAFHLAQDIWNGLINEYREEAEAIQKIQTEAAATEAKNMPQNEVEATPENITPQGNNEQIEPCKVINLKSKKK